VICPRLSIHALLLGHGGGGLDEDGEREDHRFRGGMVERAPVIGFPLTSTEECLDAVG